MRLTRTWSGFAILLTFLGCAKSGVVTETRRAGLAWPLENPRVRLETVIEFQAEAGSGVRQFMRLLGGGKREPLFERPYGVAWDGEDLLVTDPGNHRVVRVHQSGEVSLSQKGELTSPMGVAICGTSIVVTDPASGRVAALDRNLHMDRWIAEDLARPTGVACIADQLFVVETGMHRVLVREGDGPWTSIGGRGGRIGEFNYPTSVAYAGGSLWVGDTLNFRIQRFERSEGAYSFADAFGELGDAPGEMPRIKAVAQDVAGHLWVSDAHLDRVSLYGTEGRLLLSLGGTGTEHGAFSFPAGIAAHPDGRVAVVDSLNRRVQIFRLTETGYSGP